MVTDADAARLARIEQKLRRAAESGARVHLAPVLTDCDLDLIEASWLVAQLRDGDRRLEVARAALGIAGQEEHVKRCGAECSARCQYLQLAITALADVASHVSPAQGIDTRLVNR